MSKLHRHMRIVLLALAFSWAGQAWANTAVYEKTIQATCWILAPKSREQVMQGTGWVVDRHKSEVITNYHVVGDAPEVHVFFPSFSRGELVTHSSHYQGQGVRGQVVCVDKKRDLALVQLAYVPSGVKELPLAASGPSVGQTIYSIGNSSLGKALWNGTLWKFRQGTVSSLGFVPFLQSNTQVNVEARTFKTNCGLAPGDSGGPVVNDNGELVGVADAVDNETKKGISLHVDEVRQFLRLAHRNPRENFAGVEGTWTMKWKAKDQELFLGVVFEQGGRLTFEGKEKNFLGNYTFENGRLFWQVPGLNIRETVTITWEGSTVFRFTSQNVEFTCTRR